MLQTQRPQNQYPGYVPPNQAQQYPQYNNNYQYYNQAASPLNKELREINMHLDSGALTCYKVWLWIVLIYFLVFMYNGFTVPLYSYLIETTVAIFAIIFILIGLGKKSSDFVGYGFIFAVMGIVPALFNFYMRFNYQDIYRGRDAAFSSIWTSAFSFAHHLIFLVWIPLVERRLLEKRDALKAGNK